MEEDNNCPKPNCGRPESTHRYSAGKKLSICANGHSWNQAEIAAQRVKAREAKGEEIKFVGIDFAEVEKRYKSGGPIFYPASGRNPFRDPD
jgi:hypothetical protein